MSEDDLTTIKFQRTGCERRGPLAFLQLRDRFLETESGAVATVELPAYKLHHVE